MSEQVYGVWPGKGKRGQGYEHRLTFMIYRGELRVDIREWRSVTHENPGPTRNGWRLNLDDAKELHTELGNLLEDAVQREAALRLSDHLESDD